MCSFNGTLHVRSPDKAEQTMQQAAASFAFPMMSAVPCSKYLDLIQAFISAQYLQQAELCASCILCVWHSKSNELLKRHQALRL